MSFKGLFLDQAFILPQHIRDHILAVRANSFSCLLIQFFRIDWGAVL